MNYELYDIDVQIKHHHHHQHPQPNANRSSVPKTSTFMNWTTEICLIPINSIKRNLYYVWTTELEPEMCKTEPDAHTLVHTNTDKDEMWKVIKRATKTIDKTTAAATKQIQYTIMNKMKWSEQNKWTCYKLLS